MWCVHRRLRYVDGAGGRWLLRVGPRLGLLRVRRVLWVRLRCLILGRSHRIRWLAVLLCVLGLWLVLLGRLLVLSGWWLVLGWGLLVGGLGLLLLLRWRRPLRELLRGVRHRLRSVCWSVVGSRHADGGDR